jgi:hypothetical protein
MARESLFIEEYRQHERPSFEVTQSTHVDVLVDIFVQILRECFSYHPIYTYVAREGTSAPDLERTMISIVDKDTETALFLPIITTNANNMDTYWVQFSQSPFNTVLKPQIDAYGNIARDSRGRFIPSHYEYVGAYEGSISFLISAEDTIEREELCNLLHIFLVEALRDELYKRGVFVKTVNTSGLSEVPYRNKHIYQATVTASIYSEWRRKIPVGDTLKSIGYNMNVVDNLEPQETPIQPAIDPPLPVFDLKISPWIEDPISEKLEIPELLLSATSIEAPVALIFNTTTLRWEVSPYWVEVLDETGIPYENFTIDLTKKSPVRAYLDHAIAAIMQAQVFRALSSSQGRTLADGTRILNNTLIYPDGSVELRGASLSDIPTIYSTVVQGNDDVEIRFTNYNKNKNVLIAKNVTFDSEGQLISGSIYKRYINQFGQEVESLLTTSDEEFLDSETLVAMTSVDFFMILLYAEQPYKYTLAMILKQIDDLFTQLGDMSLTISYRAQKISNLAMLKQSLIDRSEKYLLRRPTSI